MTNSRVLKSFSVIKSNNGMLPLLAVLKGGVDIAVLIAYSADVLGVVIL